MLMLLSVVLTSCGDKEDDEKMDDISKDASASAITLSMYLMSEAPVSSEQELAIENAVNAITKAKFKAKLDLTFLTAQDYYTVLEENLKKQSENADLYYTEEDVDTEEETEKDALGLETLKYPALKPNQVDIFYFSGYDKYASYMNNNYLNLLNESVNGNAKALNSYLTPSLLKYMKSVNDGIYAIPTNRPIGEYTYLMLNKEVLKQLYYDTEYSEFTSLICDNVQDILTKVTELGMTDTYVPLHSYTNEIDVLNYQFWGVDENGFLSNDFSVLGGKIDPTWKNGAEGSYALAENIFVDNPEVKGEFIDQLATLSEYKQKGYYNPAAVAEGKEFAVGYIKGGAELVALYGDKYEMVPVAKPTLHTGALYENMFGVSAYTVELERSMDVIAYLNTNEEFRNLLLYGIEGENYELITSSEVDETGVPYKQVRELPNNGYKMDLYKTGNTMLAYTKVGENPHLREYGKAQNRDIQISYSMGLRLDYDEMTVHMDYFEDVRVLSQAILAEMLVQPDAEYDSEFFSSLLSKVNQSFAVTYMKGADYTGDPFVKGDERCSFAHLYYRWLEDNKIFVPEETEE